MILALTGKHCAPFGISGVRVAQHLVDRRDLIKVPRYVLKFELFLSKP